MIGLALLACAPNVAPSTLEAVIRVESGGDPLALHVNGLRLQPPPAKTAAEAARIAETYVRRGFSVDLGLMQVNSRHLAAHRVTVAAVLDPCTNIRIGGAILTEDYAAAARTRGDGQSALQAALSAYNTGDFARGFANGYVARTLAPGAAPATGPAIPAAPANPYTADTPVLVREASHVRIE